jgi:hypothetical protein
MALLSRSEFAFERREKCLHKGKCQCGWRCLAEEGPGHLDVAGHSDLRISVQRFLE